MDAQEIILLSMKTIKKKKKKELFSLRFILFHFLNNFFYFFLFLLWQWAAVSVPRGAALFDRIVDSMFEPLLQAPAGSLTVDWPGLAQRLFDLATSESVLPTGRQKLFEIRRR